MLIPVNLSGVFKSIYQAWTKKKLPFKRTPKVDGRTTTPPSFLFALYGICLYCILGSAEDLSAGRWLHAMFALFNGGFLFYAIYTFIGLEVSFEDAYVGCCEWQRKVTDYIIYGVAQLKSLCIGLCDNRGVRQMQLASLLLYSVCVRFFSSKKL